MQPGGASLRRVGVAGPQNLLYFLSSPKSFRKMHQQSPNTRPGSLPLQFVIIRQGKRSRGHQEHLKEVNCLINNN